jgi:hypothetical protein
MLVLRIYNFCPKDIEIAEIMKRIRRINGRNSFRLVKFEDIEEVKKRMPRGMRKPKGYKKTFCKKETGCELYCDVSYVTSILTYENLKNER